jgi:putative Mn2+ efflux pump MntP
MTAWPGDVLLFPSSSFASISERVVGLLALLFLGLTLSLDNFRVSVALGPLRLKWSRALRIAAAFGFWDFLSPLVGGVVGQYVGERIGAIAENIGVIVLAGYGLYLAVHSFRAGEPAELDERWAVFGLPFFLSLDNLLTGAGLGLAGVSPLFSSLLFGGCTFCMSLLGLSLGNILARFIPIRSDLLAGIGLLITAGTLVFSRSAMS